MLNLDRILQSDRLMRAMTGLNRKAFEALLPGFTETDQRSQIKAAVERQRAPGGGRKATLRTSRKKLFYILLYCKGYPTFDLMSVLFGFDRACAWDWVQGLLPLLEQTLGAKQALPARKLRSLEAFLERFPDVNAVILEGTERPVQRPKDSEKQKEPYSGKKKRHTRKQITGSTRQKRVIILTKARPGTVPDKRQLDEEHWVGDLPDAIAVEGALGFQGLQNELVNVHLPHQKPRGKAWSEQQKPENRAFSRQRVKCVACFP
ncbi:transposase family protein [Stenomitos frigidus]|uniref:transposase family protein n=1 Tax=Stenomitos frigidus TaxID=1886765 RepID=UPI001FED27B1|nr:transposase family protein [Stenomitos frigidus]